MMPLVSQKIIARAKGHNLPWPLQQYRLFCALQNIIELRIGTFQVLGASVAPPVCPSQSLAHMNVLHRHCVPFSLFPLGPNGRLHIQNDRPQLIPGFFVSMVLHGSLCSHLGAIGFEKSFPHVLWVSKVASTSSSLDLGRMDTLLGLRETSGNWAGTGLSST